MNSAFFSIEKVYKESLELFFLAHYPGKQLLSHDLGHHRRVWGFAKELISCTKQIPDPAFLQKLIIACYLHDIGMSVDPGARHGIHSRMICEKFLLQNHLPEHHYLDLLQAIEFHDDKEYDKPGAGNPVLEVLSVADDLDAFGYTGIYRYAEIYILRGVDFQVIGKEIGRNLKSRFEHFKRIFRNYPEIIYKYENRYTETDDFFRYYSEQAKSYDFNSAKLTGYCGVIKIISEIANNQTLPAEICTQKERFEQDIVISEFIRRLPEFFYIQ